MRPQYLELVDQAPSLTYYKNMLRALSGALSLLLIILVLRLALPEVSELIVEIILKLLNLINSGLDLTASQALK